MSLIGGRASKDKASEESRLVKFTPADFACREAAFTWQNGTTR